MKKILNKTDFKAGQALVQDGMTGESHWLVAVKGTFTISPEGELSIAEDQADIVINPKFRGEEFQSSLLYETDMVLKSKVDLILNATCYAPNGEDVTSLVAGVQIGGWSKFLNVFGPRNWVQIMGLITKTNPLPFQQIPIVYERAYGGLDELSIEQAFDPRNPVGRGFTKRRSHLNNLSVPNIEYMKFPTKKRSKKNRIAGFSAVSSDWQSRSRYAGTYDKYWEENRYPLLPLDFNPLYHQCAPEDQVFDTIHNGEHVRLTNLCRFSPTFDFAIPSIEIECETLIQGEKKTQPAKLQTILIEPDSPRLIMVWMNSIKCTGQEDKLQYAKPQQHIISI